MPLSLRQQWALKRTEYSLRRSDPGFAMIMRSFTLFAPDGTCRPHEQLIPRSRCGLRAALALLICVVLAAANAAAVAGSALARHGTRIWHALIRRLDAEIPARAGAEPRR